MDSPAHFFKGKKTISDIPVETLVSPIVLVDVSDKVLKDPGL
jgi:kynurenine formamidase